MFYSPGSSRYYHKGMNYLFDKHDRTNSYPTRMSYPRSNYDDYPYDIPYGYTDHNDNTDRDDKD